MLHWYKSSKSNNATVKWFLMFCAGSLVQKWGATAEWCGVDSRLPRYAFAWTKWITLDIVATKSSHTTLGKTFCTCSARTQQRRVSWAMWSLCDSPSRIRKSVTTDIVYLCITSHNANVKRKYENSGNIHIGGFIFWHREIMYVEKQLMFA